MRAFGGVAVAFVSVTLAAAPAGASAGAEGDFVARINALRARNGLAALAVDGELTAVAQGWAASMARAGRISHNPSLSRQVRSGWSLLGENVGMGGDAASVFDAFVRSPSHYRNLVHPSFTHVGVGVVTRSDGTLFTSHVFKAAGAAPVRVQRAQVAPRPAAAPVRVRTTAAPAPAPVATVPVTVPPTTTTTLPPPVYEPWDVMLARLQAYDAARVVHQDDIPVIFEAAQPAPASRRSTHGGLPVTPMLVVALALTVSGGVLRVPRGAGAHDE